MQSHNLSMDDEIQYATIPAVPAEDKRKHLLNKCKEGPFEIVGGGKNGEYMDAMLALAKKGYLTCNVSSSSANFSYGQKMYTFTLTDKGKQATGLQARANLGECHA